jgi:hypothetical protein
MLRALARTEIGGTPTQVPAAYARRSPSHYVRQLAEADVPLQIFWSIDDRVIADQRAEAGRLCAEILALRPDAHLWDFEGTWAHTAEMQSWRRLPRAIARFGLLPRRDVPPLPVAPKPVPVQTV